MHPIFKPFLLLNLLVIFALFQTVYPDTKSLSYETYAPAEDLMENLDTNLPQTSKVALSRINFYRKALGLPLWVYDPALSQMGKAHADYVVLNCKAKRPYRGHYENPKLPGYSKEGDEAARTSGLAAGNNPLSGLESLIAGVYHRLQFINPNPMRVGLGFRYDKRSHCGSTLFVSRPLNSKKPQKNTHRFITFPAEGMKDVPLLFMSEWPDPRPIQNTPEKYKEPAGYIISIHMNSRDAQNFKNIKVKVTDSQNKALSLWVTDPANPTWKTPPPEIEQVYSGYKGGNPFAKNFNAVFIIPQKPLKPAETYHVEGTMTINGETLPLSFTFQTRKPKQFILKPGAQPGSIHHYDFASSQLSKGDQLFFSSGKFSFSPLWFFQDVSIHGAGKEKTVLKLDPTTPKNQFLFNFMPGQYLIENLTFIGENGKFIYTKSGAELSLSHTRIKDAPLGVAVLSENSSLRIENSELLNIGSQKSNPFYVFPRKDTDKDGKLLLGENNTYKKINASLSWGGVGSQPNPERIWRVDNNTLKLSDALNLAGDLETIELYPGKYFIPETLHLNKTLKIIGSGKENTSLIHQGKPNTYMFALRGNGSLYLKNLSLGEKGFFLYLSDESSLTLDNITITSKGKEYFAVLNKKARLMGLNCDFRSFSPPFLLSLKDRASYTFSSLLFPEKIPKVYEYNQVRELKSQ